MHLAVLLTTFNRKEKTLLCLESLALAKLPNSWSFDIFITDDNSNDGTVEAVMSQLPNVHIEISKENLYWARGMNKSWSRAILKGKYDAFLLLNDDVILHNSFWEDIVSTHHFCINQNNIEGIYVSSTQDAISKQFSYGGRKLIKRVFGIKLLKIEPQNKPIQCQLTNANILFVPMSIVKRIGIFDRKYIHSIADYDYSLTAHAQKIPIYVTPNYGGYCTDDHGVSWLPSNTSLKQRILYLKSPKGLAYNEYCYYLWKHFPLQAPYGIMMLWMKTFFPFVWEKFK